MTKETKKKKQGDKAAQAAPEPHIAKEEVPMVAQDHLCDARLLALRHPESQGEGNSVH
jgi:hypothetical protein